MAFLSEKVPTPPEIVRIDKWLWAARFFKTRSDAANACDLNRVTSNGHIAKPARDVRVGDQLSIRNDGGEFVIEVVQLSNMRGPAAVAQTLYSESDVSKAARLQAAEERKAMALADPFAGRPTKKDRRDLQKARGRIVRF